jgi:hypothetical protein
MRLLCSRCARLGGSAIFCLAFGFGTPSSARAESSSGRLIDALADIASLLPRFTNDPADIRHLERALTQLFDVLEKHHHHHKHKHHKGAFGKGMNLSQGSSSGSQTSPVSASNPGSSVGTTATGKAGKAKANAAQGALKQNNVASATKTPTANATAKNLSHTAKTNLKGIQLAMNQVHPQLHTAVGNHPGHGHPHKK